MFLGANRYVSIKQHDMRDCGVACLAMVCKHYGLKVPLSKIREAAGTDKMGTSVYGIIKASEQLGLTAKGVKGDQEAFFSEFPLPAIAHVVMDQSLLHYVVIHKITPKQVIVADPAKGIVKYKPEDFFKIWTGVFIFLVPAPSFQQGNEASGSFSRFLKLIIPHRRLVSGLFVSSMIYTLFGILGAFYFKYLLDEILPYQLKDTLHVISIAMIILTLSNVLLSAFRSHMLLHLSQKIDISLILGYYHHVLKLPMNFFTTRQTGEVLSRLVDASKIRSAISGATLTILIDTLMVFIGGIILYIQSSFLFGVTLLVIPFYAAIVWGFQKPFERLNRQQMESGAKLNSYLVESINGMETVKAYHAEHKSNFETEKRFITMLKSVFKYGLANNIQSSLKAAVQGVGGIVILWVGAMQVLKGNMTMGQLIAYNALLAYFLSPIQNLINLQPMMQTALVAADRLAEIMDLEPEQQNETKKLRLDSLKGDIHFNKVLFRYGTRHPVLHHVDITIKQGEKVAFVGESGSGKTTLIRLLMNFYTPEEGDILIDGHNIKDMDNEALRKRISFIPQESFFFTGTIEENLCLGVDDHTDMQEIVEACKFAEANGFINELPLRYQTRLEENGDNLSGGQKQRLAIARAILKKPDILIMDEATSNLDTTTERAITRTITKLENTTTLIIAHRLSTVMRCDTIFVMDKGRIVEQGTHHELMQAKGKYYSLWRDQLSSEQDMHTAQLQQSGVS